MPAQCHGMNNKNSSRRSSTGTDVRTETSQKKKQISAIEIYDISQTQGQIISLRG